MPSPGRSSAQQALVLQRLAEVHEAPAAPGADRGGRRIHAHLRLNPAAVRARSAASRRTSACCRISSSGPAVASGPGEPGASAREACSCTCGRSLLELVDAQREVLAALGAQLGHRGGVGALELDRRVRQAALVEVQRARAARAPRTASICAAPAQQRRQALLRAQRRRAVASLRRARRAGGAGARRRARARAARRRRRPARPLPSRPGSRAPARATPRARMGRPWRSGARAGRG